jgi:hypothetical protein
MMRHHSRRNSSKSMLSSPLRSSRVSSPYGSVTCETDAFVDNRHNRETMHRAKPFCKTVGRGTDLLCAHHARQPPFQLRGVDEAVPARAPRAAQRPRRRAWTRSSPTVGGAEMNSPSSSPLKEAHMMAPTSPMQSFSAPGQAREARRGAYMSVSIASKASRTSSRYICRRSPATCLRAHTSTRSPIRSRIFPSSRTRVRSSISLGCGWCWRGAGRRLLAARRFSTIVDSKGVCSRKPYLARGRRTGVRLARKRLNGSMQNRRDAESKHANSAMGEQARKQGDAGASTQAGRCGAGGTAPERVLNDLADLIRCEEHPRGRRDDCRDEERRGLLHESERQRKREQREEPARAIVRSITPPRPATRIKERPGAARRRVAPGGVAGVGERERRAAQLLALADNQ